jgi:catechol 2,3-dioxygenase-like lactoylglutathione lyase family enzyme
MSPPPAVVAVYHHVSLTVTDLERSMRWYERVLGVRKVADRTGEGWVRSVMRSDGGLTVGLTVHEGGPADGRFDHRRVGLDHFAIACADADAVRDWVDHLDELGVVHGPIEEPGYATVVTARDPDGIAVEFFAPAS